MDAFLVDLRLVFIKKIDHFLLMLFNNSARLLKINFHYAFCAESNAFFNSSGF